MISKEKQRFLYGKMKVVGGPDYRPIRGGGASDHASARWLQAARKRGEVNTPREARETN